MVTTQEVIHRGDTEQQPSHDQPREEDNKKENPGGGEDHVSSPRNAETKEELPEVTNDVYVQIRLLRAVLHYYKQNKLYPYKDPDSLPHLKSWLQDNFIAGSSRVIIENLRREFQSEKRPHGIEGNVEESKMEKPLSIADKAIRLLADMIEYYINEKRYPFPEEKYLKDFHKNWLYWTPSSNKFWLVIKQTILALKMEYENWVSKKGNGLLVFCNFDDLMLFELADIIWGPPEGHLSQAEVDMKILAALISYYIKNWRYPFEDLKDFHKNWINDMVSFDVCTERIEILRKDWVDRRSHNEISDVDDVLLFKLSKYIWDSEEPLHQIDMDKKILAAMVDYYTSTWEYPSQKLEYLFDFHKNWLKMDITISKCKDTIDGLKKKYKEQVKKKGKDLVFSGIDDLELFKLSEFLWGSSKSANHGRFRFRT